MQTSNVIRYGFNFSITHACNAGAHDFDVAVIVATFVCVFGTGAEIAQLLGDIVCVLTAHLWKACRRIAHAGG